jgi:hypothetical protein
MCAPSLPPRNVYLLIRTPVGPIARVKGASFGEGALTKCTLFFQSSVAFSWSFPLFKQAIHWIKGIFRDMIGLYLHERKSGKNITF